MNFENCLWIAQSYTKGVINMYKNNFKLQTVEWEPKCLNHMQLRNEAKLYENYSIAFNQQIVIVFNNKK